MLRVRLRTKHTVAVPAVFSFFQPRTNRVTSGSSPNWRLQ